jgi:hypothetical protein
MRPIEGSWYIVELDEAETRIDTVEQVCDLLDRIAASESADVCVMIDQGRRPSWLRRLFGFSERLVTPCFVLQKAGGLAALTSLDGAWSEFRAIDTDRPDGISDEIRLKLSGGEPTPADPEVCMTADRAFAAARHYLLHGTRPDWFSYQYVR